MEQLAVVQHLRNQWRSLQEMAAIEYLLARGDTEKEAEIAESYMAAKAAFDQAIEDELGRVLENWQPDAATVRDELNRPNLAELGPCNHFGMRRLTDDMRAFGLATAAMIEDAEVSDAEAQTAYAEWQEEHQNYMEALRAELADWRPTGLKQ